MFICGFADDFISKRYYGPQLWDAENHSRTILKFFYFNALGFGPVLLFLSAFLFLKNYSVLFKRYFYLLIYFASNLALIIFYSPFFERVWFPVSFCFVIFSVDLVYSLFDKPWVRSLILLSVVLVNLVIVMARILI